MKVIKLIIVLSIILIFIECDNKHLINKEEISEIAFPININEDEPHLYYLFPYL